MCAIVGSSDTERFQQLFALNSYRGTFSSSFALIQDGRLTHLHQTHGLISSDSIAIEKGTYAIGHRQAPTSVLTDKDKTIHPARESESLLWHNGILKAREIKRLQKELGTDEGWDSLLLLKFIRSGGDLSDIDGSFACVLFDEGRLFVFRNELVPLFWHEGNGDLSSTEFSGSALAPANKMIAFDPLHQLSETVSAFQTKENPYYLPA